MKIPIVALVLAVLWSGCALFTSPYDYVTTEYIRELTQRTKEVVADGNARRLTLANSRKFLRESQAQVGILRIRANETYMSDDARTLLDILDRCYATLLEHRSPLRTSNTFELRSALNSLQNLAPYRPVRFSSTQVSSPPEDPFDSTDTDTTTTKKDDDKKRDRKDRDRDDDKRHKKD